MEGLGTLVVVVGLVTTDAEEMIGFAAALEGPIVTVLFTVEVCL